VNRMNDTHFAAKRADRLTVEEKMQRRQRSYENHWRKEKASARDPSLSGLHPRDDSNAFVIELVDEDGQPLVLPEPQRRYEFEDDWPREEPRSFLRKWMDEQRRSQWLPSRPTPIQEKAESLVDKIGAAIRSVLSEPAQEDNSG
jgi:hypothetical protein